MASSNPRTHALQRQHPSSAQQEKTLIVSEESAVATMPSYHERSRPNSAHFLPQTPIKPSQQPEMVFQPAVLPPQPQSKTAGDDGPPPYWPSLPLFPAPSHIPYRHRLDNHYYQHQHRHYQTPLSSPPSSPSSSRKWGQKTPLLGYPAPIPAEGRVATMAVRCLDILVSIFRTLSLVACVVFVFVLFLRDAIHIPVSSPTG